MGRPKIPCSTQLISVYIRPNRPVGTELSPKHSNHKNRFLSAEALRQNQEIHLSEDESHHLKKVLRHKVGDLVEVFDGLGRSGEGKVVELSGKRVLISIGEVEEETCPFHLHLAFGIGKSSAVEFIIKRVGEVGVKSFQPLVTDHSLHPGEWNTERWERISLEAQKQCQSNFLPVVNEPIRLDDWLAKRSHRTLVFCDEAERDGGIGRPAGEVDLLIGAEGGWSERERKLVSAAHALVLGLGRNRLRTETAALVAVLLMKVKLGEI